MTAVELCAWLSMVVRPLVTKPDTVNVVEAGRSGGTFLLALCVDPVDRRYAIGKDGQTIRALRVLAAAVSGRHGLRIALDLQDETSRP